jgi:hypothetical protein
MTHNWTDIEQLLQSVNQQAQRGKHKRAKQRKWREIESLKERQRMRRELLEYNECDI